MSFSPIVLLVCSAALLSAIFYATKPMPEGLAVASAAMTADNVEFLHDSTWQDDQGTRHSEQQIFDAMLEMVAGARKLLVVDMFLFNDFAGNAGGGHRPLTRQFTDAVVKQRKLAPELEVVFITDPFNTFYGSMASPYLKELEKAGVNIIISNLDALPDSNPLWSGWWRLCCQWLPEPEPGGWLPNPVADDKVTLRSWLRLLNFKANHRKTLVADQGDDWVGLVASANIHDASSLHSNVALKFTGPAALALLQTEQAVARMSGKAEAISMPSVQPGNSIAGEPSATLRIVTEAKIRDTAAELIDASQPGEQLDIVMFYFSHRDLLARLINAHRRGVDIRVIVDPNRDAFGREKGGIPNRQTAMEMQRAGIPVRWCDTHGEQCHGKMLMRLADSQAELLLGSANFTRRNLDNLNLETNVHLQAPPTNKAISQASRFFEQRWNNHDDKQHTLAYPAYADHSRWRYWRYRVMEATGMSSF